MFVGKRIALIVLGLIAVTSTWAQANKALTNEDVINMAKQGLGDVIVIKAIQANETDFDVSPKALAELQNDGISQPIMDAMLTAQTNKRAATLAVAAAVSSMPTAADVNAGKYLLKESIEVPLKFASDLSSKTANEGDPVEMLLDGDLKVGDIVIAKSGSRALAVVSNAKKAGMMGKAGELNIQLQHLVAGENRIRVRGTKGRQGDSKTGAAVALTVLFGPIGLIKHGKNVEVKAGTPLTAYVDQDIWLPPAN
jgi:hypothetical protein